MVFLLGKLATLRLPAIAPRLPTSSTDAPPNAESAALRIGTRKRAVGKLLR